MVACVVARRQVYRCRMPPDLLSKVPFLELFLEGGVRPGARGKSLDYRGERYKLAGGR